MLDRFLRRRPHAIGVDFGSRHLRAVQVRETASGLALVGAAALPLEEGRGLPPAERLREAIVHGGFAGRRCVVGVPRSEVTVQTVRLPVMPDPELREAAAWEASQRLRTPREAMEVDCIRSGTVGSGADARLEVVLVAVMHEHLLPRLEFVMQAGLVPEAVDPGFCAIARTFGRRHRRDVDGQRVRALLDLGRSGSTVAMLRGDGVAFVKPLQIGGRHLDEAVAESLGVDAESAHRVRSTAPSDEAVERAVFEATRPVLHEIVREFTLCLRYHGVTFRGPGPEVVLLTGSGGDDPRLGAMLAEATNLRVAVDDEIGTLASLSDRLGTRLRAEPGPIGAWANAIGLGLRSAGNVAELKEAA